MMPVNLVHASLDEFLSVLRQLSDEQYAQSCEELSGLSVGEHTRHAIEMLQGLVLAYKSGFIDYDLRERNKQLETSVEAAMEAIAKLKSALYQENRELVLKQSANDEVLELKTSYFRELLYNLEHCIHHQALIKVGLRKFDISLPENFGIARSTLLYRSKCAQ